jgi:uncharacterized membrane protein YfcA
MLAILATLGACSNIGHACTEVNTIYDCGLELLCMNGTCEACVTDADCDEMAYCRTTSNTDYKVCMFEPLTHPWNARLIGGVIVMFIAGAFVSGAGIGGGTLFVPIMMLVIGFPAEYCITQSNPIILGGSLAVTAANFRSRHHLYDRPLINYNVASIIEPVSWLGSIVGVIINRIIPDWLLYVLQFILLVYAAYSTFTKGLAEWRKRKAAKEKELEEMKTGLAEAANVDAPAPLENPVTAEPAPAPENPIEEALTGEAPKRAFSPGVLVVLATIWIIFNIIPFFRGGPTTSSLFGISFCSAAYWAMTFGPFPIALAISAVMVKIAKNYPVVGEKADLNGKMIAYMFGAGFFAGICSGFLGIGGGVIKGPILLALGIGAEEMAATSSFMILLTSSINSIQFIARGSMPIEEFGIYSAIGFVAFLIGANVIKVYIARTQNRSIVLFVLASAISISACLIFYLGTDNIVSAVKKGMNMGFRPYCTG